MTTESCKALGSSCRVARHAYVSAGRTADPYPPELYTIHMNINLPSEQQQLALIAARTINILQLQIAVDKYCMENSALLHCYLFGAQFHYGLKRAFPYQYA